MRRICVITGSRAEYGLLYWTIKALSADKSIDLRICVTGMHLSPEFGLTYKQIEEDGFIIDAKVEMLLSSDSSVGISKSIGLGVIGFSEYFQNRRPDILLVLGDRFEIFAAVTTAMIFKIPVAHCHGGEATEGLIDEPIRHSISKMSHLHFTATEEYSKRVIQLGEQPQSVYNVGALGIESINKFKLLDKNEFEKAINFTLGNLTFLITFHPVTLENATAHEQFSELLEAIDKFPDAKIIFTKPNADNDGRIIISMIDEYVSKNKNRSVSYISLGQLRYLSALKHVNMVIGNSSSGLIEVPSFKKATINIGDRQRGRVKSNSVIDCEPKAVSITKAIETALSEEFLTKLLKVENPYGSGNASEVIIKILSSVPLDELIKKRFYNL